MKTNLMTRTVLSLILASFATSAAHAAYTPITRSFHSVRTAGMGDVRYTVGEYEENFFANPARMTSIDSNRFQLPKISIEASSAAISSLSKLVDSSDSGLSAMSDAVGKPVSARFQLVLPAYYSKEFVNDKWALGIGLVYSANTSWVASQTGYIDPITLISAGPALTVARRLLDDNVLSVGATMHAEFRASSNSVFSMKDFLAGNDLSTAIKGGSGMGIDFDIGTTYRPRWGLGGFAYELGLAFNNLLGGKYTNLGGKLNDFRGDPLRSKTSASVGISATKKDWGPFQQVLFALELTDFGNNDNGSLFRTLHLGGEAQWKSLTGRLGFNQGYFTGGLGVDVGFFDLNLATYGEEMGLNAGTIEDRRYALEFGFHI